MKNKILLELIEGAVKGAIIGFLCCRLGYDFKTLEFWLAMLLIAI